MKSEPNVISGRRSWIRVAAVVILLMSPSPLLCYVLAERVLERATVNYLRSRFDRGELTFNRREVTPTASALDAARSLWFEAHDVNFGIGFVVMVALVASTVLAAMAIALFQMTRTPKGKTIEHASRSEGE